MKEEEIRARVRQQRELYQLAVQAAGFNFALILIWALLDSGSSFWPKYVIFVTLVALGIKAYVLGLLPFFKEKMKSCQEKIHFMSEEWEEEKVSELMGKKKSPVKSETKAPQKKVEGRTKKKKSS